MEVKRKKCNVVMLPTNEADNAIIQHYGTLEYHGNKYFTQEYLKTQKKTSSHLYIISDDEIKEDDWFYDILNNSVHQFTKKLDKDFKPQFNWYKVIATTDKSLSLRCKTIVCKHGSMMSIFHPCRKKCQNIKSLPQPSQSFIKKYCKLGGIVEVLVEYESYHGIKTSIAEINTISGDGSKNWKGIGDNRDYKLKTDSHNTITIKPVKEKMYSLTEVKALTKAAYDEGDTWRLWLDKIAVDFGEGKTTEEIHKKHSYSTWIKENL